jgi:hypothetical protein
VPPSPKPRPVGRPQRTFIDRVRDVVWSRFVLHRAAVKTPQKLRLELLGRDKRAAKKLPTVSVFYKYLRGDAGPTRVVVDALDAAYPGTGRVFDHPVWILANSKSLDITELGDVLHQISGTVTAGWVQQWCSRGQLFWRVPEADLGSVFQQIAQGKDLDHLAGALGLLHDARFRQDQRAHFEAWQAVARVAQNLRADPVLGVIYPHFVAALARDFVSTPYVDTEVQDWLDAFLDEASERANEISQELIADPDRERDFDLFLNSELIAPISLLEYAVVETLAPIEDAAVTPRDFYRPEEGSDEELADSE